MNVESLLSALRKVRQSAPGEWTACCPAHEDKNPSLGVKDADGTIMLHCFAGCSVEQVCGALGVTVSDLFPGKLALKKGEYRPRLPWNPRTVLELIGFQAIMVSLAALDLSKGIELSIEDREKLFDASGAIHEAMRYVTR